ncbi:MAG: type II toxin-antitoxin system RelE/ParE family toxin, partial [Clostridia bacterium]
MNVIITNKARKDLIEIFDYSSKKSIRFAIETDKKIRSYIEDLSIFPYIGR